MVECREERKVVGTFFAAALEDSLSGHGRLTMLAGEPGIGKTRTAKELTTYAGTKGAQAHNDLIGAINLVEQLKTEGLEAARKNIAKLNMSFGELRQKLEGLGLLRWKTDSQKSPPGLPAIPWWLRARNRM